MCLGKLAEVIDVSAKTAMVSCDGRPQRVSLLTLTEPLTPGDWVVIHSGFALARLTADEAGEAIALRHSRTQVGSDDHDRRTDRAHLP